MDASNRNERQQSSGIWSGSTTLLEVGKRESKTAGSLVLMAGEAIAVTAAWRDAKGLPWQGGSCGAAKRKVTAHNGGKQADELLSEAVI